MRRSRKFLSLILVLLVINTLFFVAWYAFDAQGRVKGIVERQAGKALKGKMRIGAFTISDQQVYAENISFAAADSTLIFTVDNARARFNLLRFIFSGLKMRNLLDHIEIDQADVQLAIVPKPKKPKKKVEIPNLLPIFNDLIITNSSFKASAKIPLKIGEAGILTAIEELDKINLTVINTKVSNLSLDAVSANGGSLKVSGILDKGRLASSRVELRDYSPLYVDHPQIRDFTGVLDIVASASQKTKGATPDINAQLSLKDASALVWGQYQVSIPLLDINTNKDMFYASIAQSKVGTSTIGGMIRAHSFLDNPVLDPSQLDLRLDLSMLGPKFTGIVDATLFAEGTLADPILNLVAGSEKLSFDKQSLQSITLTAAYEDETVDLTMLNAIWQNQRVNLVGTFTTQDRKLTGKLDTSPVRTGESDMRVSASADLELNFSGSIPEVRAQIHDLSYAQKDIAFNGLSGYANFLPLITDTAQNYLVDVNLKSPLGIGLTVIGDIKDSYFLVEADLNSLELADAYPDKTIKQYNPILNGGISAFITGSKTVLSGNLELAVTKGMNLSADLDLIGSYDLKTKQGNLVLDIPNGQFNDQPLALEVVAQIRDQLLKVNSLNLNNQLFASGELNLKDTQDFEFQVATADIDSEMITAFFPKLQMPEINGIDLTATYSSKDDNSLDAILSIGEVKIPGLRTLSAELTLLGDLQLIDIRGSIRNETKQLVDLAGDAVLDKGWNLRLNALATYLDMEDLMYSPLADGSVSGNVGFFISDVLTKEREMSFDARLVSTRLWIPDIVDFDDVLISVAQTKNLLIVDSLYVRASEFGYVTGSGALDYNLLENRIYEGDHTLDLKAEGLLFEWLKNNIELVRDASGKASLECSIRTLDDQLLIQSGKLRISEGRLVLDEQPEDIRNIEIDADIAENQVLINNLTAQMGTGVLTAKNFFDDDQDSHLQVAMLDFGKLLVKVDEPGALLYIPYITLPRSRSRIVLRGQNSEYATVSGPFDDMKITAEALVSEASIVYPPNTNNLLNLIYSFRGSPPRDPEIEILPMPFNLDLWVYIQDNVKYATYPTNFVLTPGGSMHILFDGRKWLPQESSISSEKGMMDFFGTKFTMEYLDFNISGSSKMVTIAGALTHETADGTIVTLNVSTDKTNPSASILQRIKFDLISDNPADVSTANILGRMRYNSSSEQLSANQQGNLLQDEALSLISENLNTSLLSPILYPLENNVRRWLRLDDFSIRAGFIQNLFTEYSTDPNHLANYADMGQFVGNISQFSSSILLNNLSLYMSKYLGRKFFLDYTLTLQEATNLENHKEIFVYHNTSLRWYLPQQFRLAYSFKYEPREKQISHELMLQKSFKFWVF